MEYTTIDKERLMDLDYLLNQELKMIGKGGCSCHTSVLCCNTMQYHGMFIGRLNELDNENHILLSFLEEKLYTDKDEYALGAQRKSYGFHFGNTLYIEEINTSVFPIIKFVFGKFRLRKEILLSNHAQQLLIRYTLTEGDSPLKLVLKPFLAFRKTDQLTTAFPNIADPLLYVNNGFQTKLHNHYPALSIQLSKLTDIKIEPSWFYDFSYKTTDGSELLKEDLYVPGSLIANLFPEESIILSVGLKEIVSESLDYLFNKEIYNSLSNSFTVDYK